MRTPSVTMNNIFDGMQILVLPDDDERLKELEPGCIGCDGARLYIGETIWKSVRPMLVKNTPNT